MTSHINTTLHSEAARILAAFEIVFCSYQKRLDLAQTKPLQNGTTHNRNVFQHEHRLCHCKGTTGNPPTAADSLHQQTKLSMLKPFFLLQKKLGGLTPPGDASNESTRICNVKNEGICFKAGQLLGNPLMQVGKTSNCKSTPRRIHNVLSLWPDISPQENRFHDVLVTWAGCLQLGSRVFFNRSTIWQSPCTKFSMAWP